MSITKELTKSVEQFESKLNDNSEVKKYEESLQEFEKLVQLGVTKKRGNNSFQSTEITSENILFNI